MKKHLITIFLITILFKASSQSEIRIQEVVIIPKWGFPEFKQKIEYGKDSNFR